MVAPTAIGILTIDNQIDCPLELLVQLLAQLAVGDHAVYLGQEEGRKAVLVHGAVSGGNRTLVGRDGAEQISGQAVTREFFSVLGVPPIAGRGFQEEDEHTKANVVMLSERIWRTKFGGDPKLVGRAIPLDGEQYTAWLPIVLGN